MKKLSLLLLPLLLCGSFAWAQVTHQDSMTVIAKADAQSFMLNKTDLKGFRKLGPGRRNSDYFKPVAANVSNAKLLQDSAYVKAYRHTAFIKTRKRHTAGHYILIIGSAITGTIVIMAIIIVATDGIYTGGFY